MRPSRRKTLRWSLLLSVFALALATIFFSLRRQEPDYQFLRDAKPVDARNIFEYEHTSQPHLGTVYRYLKRGTFSDVLAEVQRELRPPIWTRWSFKSDTSAGFASRLDSRGRANTFRSTLIDLYPLRSAGSPRVLITVRPPGRKVEGAELYVRERLAKMSGR